MKKINKTKVDIYNECFNLMEFLKKDRVLNEGAERDDVINKIENEDFDVNNYESFSQELKDSPRACFLTRYSPEELQELGITTYQVNGYPIGFALHPINDKDIDFVGVHNNSGIGHVADALLRKAIELKGNQLDHFEGKLSDIYGPMGFKETGRDQWSDEYAPDDWDYEQYGRPDVVYRHLEESKKGKTIYLTESQFKKIVRYEKNRQKK